MCFSNLPYPGTELALLKLEWGINYIQSYVINLFAYRANTIKDRKQRDTVQPSFEMGL